MEEVRCVKDEVTTFSFFLLLFHHPSHISLISTATGT